MPALVTVNGRFELPDTAAGGPGTMTWVLVPGNVPDRSEPVTVLPGPVSVPIDTTGAFTVTLRATDDPDLVEHVSGTLRYQVTRTIGIYKSYWYVTVPQPGPWDWTQLSPAPGAGNVVVVPAPGPPGAAGGMNWRGAWQQGYYAHKDVTRDGNWTMVCVNPGGTSARPAPESTASPAWILPDVPPWTEIDTSIATLWLGRRAIVQAQVGYIHSVRYWDPAIPLQVNVVFDVLLRFRPNTPSTSMLVLAENIQQGGGTGIWKEIALVNPIQVLGGETFDLVKVIRNQTGHSDTPLSYSYQKPNNPAIPSAGQIIHANNALDYIRVSKTGQASTDNAAFLATVKTGWQIAATGIVWDVTQIIDSGSYIEFHISPAVSATSTGIQNFIFRNFTPAPVRSLRLVDYWLNSPTRSGFIYDPGTGQFTATEDAYAVDIKISTATISPDWDIVALFSR